MAWPAGAYLARRVCRRPRMAARLQVTVGVLALTGTTAWRRLPGPPSSAKRRPSRPRHAGLVEDFTDSHAGQAKPPLLIRHAAAAAAQQAATLLRDVPLDLAEVAEMLGQRGVLVLCDVTLPPTAPPVGAVAFRVDRQSRTAVLAGAGVLEPWRGRELGHRLITGALTVARADGVERVLAWAEPGSPWESLLADAGFVADNGTADAGGRRHYLLLL